MSGSADAFAAELRAVRVRYGAVHALRGVDLTIPRARVTALLGPNGAGKTTAVRVLLGIQPADDGVVRVLGHPPNHRAARRRVGAMMQIAKVPETLRVSEHIDTFRSYYPRPLTRDAIIDAAGLHGLERRLFGTLSGGERQRVLLALALAGDPDLLFLDEPTVGMDVETRHAFWNRIRRLREDGRAVLLTTHYLEEADALADRVVVLHRGRVVADDTPDVIKRGVARRRIRCSTTLDIEMIRRIAHVDHAELNGDAVVLLTTRAEDVVRTLLARDASLHSLEVGGAALEDAFLELTRAAQLSEVA